MLLMSTVAVAQVGDDTTKPILNSWGMTAPQTKKLDVVANSTLTDDTATKLNALLATLKAKGYM